MNNEIQELEKEQKSIAEKVSNIIVTDTESLKFAISTTQEIKEKIKKIEGIRKFFVDPLNKQVKEINSKFKPFIEKLEEAESIIKNKMVKFQIIQEDKRKKAEEKLRKEQEKKYRAEIKKADKKGELPPPPPMPVFIERQKVEGLQIKKVWNFEIIDEKIIPRVYLVVDTAKIRKLVNAGIREIAGVKIYEETISAISKKDELDNL